MNKNKTFNRRILLRGLGGAAVAAPFLSSIMEKEAKAQGMTATPPKRLIVFFTYHGCLTDKWFPAKSHGTLSTADYQSMVTLAPMAPYAAKLLMVRGIRSMNEWSFQGTLGQKNDPHTNPAGSTFTAYPLTPNATTSSANNAGKFDATPTGMSLDHIAAHCVNKASNGMPVTSTNLGASPLFMQIGGVQGSVGMNQSVISWSDSNGTIFPGIGSPSTVYSNLTNLFTSGTPMNADTYAVARGKSVIDCVRDDLSRLSSMNMSSADKSLLQTWTDLLHYVGGTVSAGAMCNMSTASTLGLTGTLSTSNIQTTANTFQDLAVLSALCDSNRVIFLKMPANGNFSSVVKYKQSSDGSMQPIGTDAHAISHRIGNAGMGGQCIPDALAQIQAVDNFYAGLFARFVGRLDMFNEGSGTLLDNTATVWIQEMSDGDSHNLNNLPILQAGSCQGYFKTGWAINVENANPTMSPGASSTDCANGSTAANLDSVGTPSGTATMPINKYFCNLLNAIGAQADSSGYAAPGGTAGKVSKFGKYDNTTYFSDGGTKASVIEKPGEYTELLA